MEICMIVAVVMATVVVMAAVKMSGECSRQEEEYPCEYCLRWPECNGVDENCPWRAE